MIDERREGERRDRQRWCSGRRLGDLVAHFLAGDQMRCPGTVRARGSADMVCGEFQGDVISGRAVVRVLHVDGRNWLDAVAGGMGYRRRCHFCKNKIEVVFMSQEAA